MLILVIGLGTAFYAILNMSSVQDYAKDKIVQELKGKLKTDLGIEKLHFRPFSTIELTGVYINDRAGNKILLADRLFANLDLIDLINKKITINSVELSDFDIYLSKASKDSTLNIQFILDAFKKKDTTETKPLFEFDKISVLSITEGRFYYNIEDQEVKPTGFDANHIAVSNINTRLSIKTFTKDSVNVQIKHLDLKEKSGFMLENLMLRLTKSKENIVVKGLKLKLPNSNIQFDKCNITVPKRKPDETLLDVASINCVIKSSYIVPADISAFVPQLNGFKERVLLATTVRGGINNLVVDNLTLDSDEKIHLAVSGELKNLRDKDKLHLNGNVSELKISTGGIQEILNNLSKVKKDLPKEIVRLGTIFFRGGISGNPTNFLAKGRFDTDLGNVDTDLRFGFKPTESVSSFFDGTVSTTNFQLGKLFDNNQLNVLSFNLDIDVLKPVKLPLKGSVKGLVEQLDFKNYSYKNIQLDGECDGLTYNGLLQLDDENGFLSANGFFDFSEKVPVFDFEAKLKNVRLDKLHLAEQYKDSYLTTNLSVNILGLNIDDLQGRLTVDSLNFRREDMSFVLDNFTVDAFGFSPDKHLIITSDILNGELLGSYSFSSLAKDLEHTFATYMPALMNPNLKQRSIEARANDMSFHFAINNTEPLSRILSLPVTVLDTIIMDGFYKGASDKLNLKMKLPALIAAGMNIRGGNLVIENEGNGIKALLDAKILGKNNIVNTIKLDSYLLNNKIDSKISFENNGKQQLNGSLSLATTFSRIENNSALKTSIDLLPSQFLLSDTIWKIGHSNIRIKKDLIEVDNFMLSNASNQQYISMDGAYSTSDPSDILMLRLQNINLDYVFNILNIGALEFGGHATGVVAASSIQGKPYAKVNLKVADFKFNQHPIGDLMLYSDLDEETMQINLKGNIFSLGTDTNLADINGFINPVTSELSIVFDAKGINLGFLNKYTSSLFNNLGGIGRGKVRLFGDFSNVTVEGKAFVENGTLGINFLNTTYSFSDSIFMKKDLIYFDELKLRDINGNIATITGQVVHNYFADFVYQVNMTANNFMLYNATESHNNIFYGQVFGTGTGSVSGDEQVVDIDANIKTNEHTKVKMNFMEEKVSEYSFITYKTNKAPVDSVYTNVKDQTSRRLITESGMEVNMSFYVDATPDAQVEIVMDPVGGDVIKGRGSGTMKFVWGTKTEPLLYGTYMIDNGNYNFTFQKILERNFAIQQGSTVQFRGDPFEAILDVTAIYKVNANLNDISSKMVSYTGPKTVPVQCILMLKDGLRHPKISLDVALPSVDSEVQTQVKALMNTEDMVNRQIVYLLLLSKFYTASDQSTQNQTSELASVASATLSAQLTSILGQIDDRWQFGANIRANDAELTTTEVELLMSRHLLNDRLLINGNFGYRENTQNQSAFIGDVDVEYILGKSRTWRLKAYNHSNEKYYYQNAASHSVQTQGIGIMYKKDFDHFLDIFGKKRMVKSEEKRDSINPTKVDTMRTGSHLGTFIKIKEN